MTTGISREQAELLLMEEARLIDERRFGNGAVHVAYRVRH